MTDAFKESLHSWMGIGYDSLGNIFDGLSTSQYKTDDQMVLTAFYYGVDQDSVDEFTNNLDSEAFMKSLRDPLAPRSMDLVNKIYDILEIAKTGITMSE